MNGLVAILTRDLRLAFRAGGGALNGVVFFALTVLIFALAVGPDRVRLSASAAPILWTAATLAAMLSFDRIFQSDFEDGSLDALLPDILVIPQKPRDAVKIRCIRPAVCSRSAEASAGCIEFGLRPSPLSGQIHPLEKSSA